MIKDFTPAESEEAILSLLLRVPQTFYEITNLKSFMFSSEPLGDLFTIIREIHEEKGTPDFHILEEKAQTRRGLDSIGGKPFLDRLEELYEKPDINPSNFRQYEAIVANAYKTRKVTEFCALTPSEIRDVMQIDGTIHKLRDNLETLLKEASPDEVSILGDLVGDVLESIKSREQNPGIVGLSTGIPELDYKTAGMMDDDVWVVSGRPGQGKTALICNMLLSNAKNKKSPLLVSLEMGKQVLVERMLAIDTGIQLYPNIRMGELSDKELNNIVIALDRFKDYPIFLDTHFVASLEYLETIIRKYHHNEGVDVVYVDYIQLLAERDSEATHALGRISRKAKLLGKELNIPIVLVSQLNRNVEARPNKRPILSDLRQSGNLEEDPDVVIGLYRDSYYSTNSPDPNLLECILLKQRNGPTTTVHLDFDLTTNRILDRKAKGNGKQTKAERLSLGETANRLIELQTEPLGI